MNHLLASKRLFLFLFFTDELNPLQSVEHWLEQLGVVGVKITPGERHGIVLSGKPQVMFSISDALQGGNEPQGLYSALVMNGCFDHRRIKGRKWHEQRKRFANARGRKARLNALPHELGEPYWQNMTHPDYARAD